MPGNFGQKLQHCANLLQKRLLWKGLYHATLYRNKVEQEASWINKFRSLAAPAAPGMVFAVLNIAVSTSRRVFCFHSNLVQECCNSQSYSSFRVFIVSSLCCGFYFFWQAITMQYSYVRFKFWGITSKYCAEIRIQTQVFWVSHSSAPFWLFALVREWVYQRRFEGGNGGAW